MIAFNIMFLIQFKIQKKLKSKNQSFHIKDVGHLLRENIQAISRYVAK